MTNSNKEQMTKIETNLSIWAKELKVLVKGYLPTVVRSNVKKVPGLGRVRYLKNAEGVNIGYLSFERGNYTGLILEVKNEYAKFS